MKTQVGIVGAGPAGLTLALLLEQAGIEAVVLERRDRATIYVQQQVVRDLIDACGERGVEVRFEVEDVAVHDLDSEGPYLTFAGEADYEHMFA